MVAKNYFPQADCLLQKMNSWYYMNQNLKIFQKHIISFFSNARFIGTQQ